MYRKIQIVLQHSNTNGISRARHEYRVSSPSSLSLLLSSKWDFVLKNITFI